MIGNCCSSVCCEFSQKDAYCLPESQPSTVAALNLLYVWYSQVTTLRAEQNEIALYIYIVSLNCEADAVTFIDFPRLAMASGHKNRGKLCKQSAVVKFHKTLESKRAIGLFLLSSGPHDIAIYSRQRVSLIFQQVCNESIRTLYLMVLLLFWRQRVCVGGW